MFCPNCGKDCGNSNFCPNCGARLGAQAAAPTAWVPGMACPHCGGTKLDGKNCAFCGALLRKSKSNQDDSYSIPCGFYKGVMGSLRLYEKECVIKNRVLFKTYETTIPYDQITAVVYERPLPTSFANGNLLLRWEGNKTIPIPPQKQMTADKTAVSTSTYIDTLFYHIFYMLKAFAPESAEYRMIIPEVNIPGLEEYSQKADLEEYYHRFTPLRAKAVEAFCQRTGASEQIGKVLIDRVFDVHQQAIYDADPMEAIRDLNLVVQEKIRNEEEAAQARAQRREQYARDEIRLALEEIRRKQE